MHLGCGEDDEATVENCEGLSRSDVALGRGDALVIPANWIMLRARRPSTAIKISKILFLGWVSKGFIRITEGGNSLSKREEGKITWYGLG